MSFTPESLLSLVPESLQQTVSNYWQDWSGACEKAGFRPHVELSEMGKVWACSEFVARQCIRWPGMLNELAGEGFAAARSADDYQQLVAQSIAAAEPTDEGLMCALRILRQKEMVRIAWRDLAGLAEVEQVLHELSDFAEAVIGQTLDHLYQQTTESLGMPTNAQGEAQQEIDDTIGSRPIGVNDLRELPYLEMCLKESLRRLPAVWIFAREAQTDLRLGDYLIPKGAILAISPS